MLCCDCGRQPPPDTGACPACGSSRVLRHEELHDLAIAHVDCDAFYAAIENRDLPELRDIPMIVGGRYRGVVAACCYVPHTYGTRSAVPIPIQAPGKVFHGNAGAYSPDMAPAIS